MKIARLFVPITCLLCGHVALLSATDYGRINVQEISLVENRADRTEHGYVEYRFRVTNRDRVAHRVAVSIPREALRRGTPMLTRSSNGIEVPPESTVTIRLLQPPVEMSGNHQAAVSIDGYVRRDSTPFHQADNHLQSYSRHSNDIANIFVGQRVSSEMRDLLRHGVPTPEVHEEDDPALTVTSPAAAILTPPIGIAGPTTELISWLANAPVEEWSDSWLAYTRFDAVVLADEEWRELESRRPAVLAALRKYTEAGGILAVTGTDWKAPREWRTADGSRMYQAVFGTAFLLGKDAGAAAGIDAFRHQALEGARMWRTAMGDPGGRFRGATSGRSVLTGESTLLDQMPVLENYGVSVKLIMILIIVFAILIGPVNIYILSLLKRRIWLLWTVPVTSLVASILVLGVSFFQEGILRQASSTTYTVLDQRREEATTFGFLGYYSTLTPRGLRFSPETEATAGLNRGHFGDSRSLEIELIAGGNQFFSRGWINARVPAYFAIRKAESQRKERMTFDWSAEPPTATNGLGVNVKKLIVRAPDGRFYMVDEIAAGRQVPLEESSHSVEKPSPIVAGNELQSSFVRNLRNGPTVSMMADPTHLPAGTYLAELDVWNPFVEPGIDRMKPYENRTTIFGIFE